MTNMTRKNQTVADDMPPILKSWPRFYVLVAGNLILLLVLFYAFTEVFK